MAKYRRLNIEIHNPDGCYGSTQTWFYDYQEYQNKSVPDRKYIAQEMRPFVDAGYQIGNVFWCDDQEAA